MRVTSGRSERPWKSKGSKIQTRLLKLQVNTSLENKEVGRRCKYFALQSAAFKFLWKKIATYFKEQVQTLIHLDV